MTTHHRGCCATVLVAVLLMSSASPGANIADLRSDWSNSANPNVTANGAWAYTEELTPLPFVASWAGIPGVPGWGPDENVGGRFLPFYSRALPEVLFTDADMLPGDVSVHSTDNFNGMGYGPAVLTWTSAVSGTFTLHGMFWPLRTIGRINTVSLTLTHNGNTTPLAQGVVSGDGSDSRCDPLRFTLPDIDIAIGDVLTLAVIRVTAEGDFVGMNLSVSTGPCPSVPGDLDNNGIPDGDDISAFTSCLLSGATNCGYCPCADMDGNNVIDTTDVPLFVAALLS